MRAKQYGNNIHLLYLQHGRYQFKLIWFKNVEIVRDYEPNSLPEFNSYEDMIRFIKHESVENKPEYGKVYALTGRAGDKCIANGNTWAESVVVE